MVNRLSGYLLIFLFALLNSACGGRPDSLRPEEYNRWIHSAPSGLVQEKEVNHVKMQAQFLPAAYLAYKEYASQGGSSSYDSILNEYRCGLTFQFSIQAERDDQVYGNLLYYDVSSKEEVTERINYFNFRINEFIYLQQNGRSIEPVLTSFDGFDQIGNKAVFQVSFLLEEYKCGALPDVLSDLTLVFDDPAFDLGTNRFLFKGPALQEIPQLVLP